MFGRRRKTGGKPEPEVEVFFTATPSEGSGAAKVPHGARLPRALERAVWRHCDIEVHAQCGSQRGVSVRRGCRFEGKDAFKASGLYAEMKKEAASGLRAE